MNQTAMSLLGAVPDMINGQQSLTTLFGLLENTSEQPYTGRRSIEFDGSVRAENVSFSYHADGGPSVKRIPETIAAGSAVS
jgi:ABC-type bacteriocin/lantibiotic exporter with double-glycine peptidase domain